MPVKSHVEADKGRQVGVVGGTWEGRKGWVHTTANTFPEKIWIIIASRNINGRREPEKARLILKENVSYQLEESPPTTFEEALLQEHKDIANEMKQLAKKLAEFNDYNPNASMGTIFLHMWTVAKNKRNRASRTNGSRFVRSFTRASPMETSASLDTTDISNVVLDDDF